ncbi:acyltransferase [Erwinia psidii]|uniref:acyltransferase family protein n=1 Tax=Erwinia psidii TaxID=69224 RepID=UPI00226B542F|nr:acyltransferase [Erwinia psidii]MCX8963106.1 acyltransferase [Erwinia psidii]
MNNHTYRGVQALRGLAALSVMLFHFRWNINAVSPGLGDKLFGWGATGVDLFFLISGFVITLSAAKTPQGIGGSLTFLKKRALRILPAYYIILVVTFFLSGAMSTFHYADKTANFISALTFTPLFPECAPFYVDDNGMYGIRWTLNYEVMFYVFVSFALLFPCRLLSVFLIFSVTLVLLPVLLWGGISLQPSGYPAKLAILGLVTNPMIWLFLAGAAIGLSIPYLRWLPPQLMACVAAMTLIAAGYLFSHGLYTGHGVLSSGWLYGIILLSIVLSESVIGKFVPSVLMYLGNISFSLYLIHTLMNTGIGKRFEGVGIEDGYARFSVSVLISIILAWLSWKYIECPFIRPGKKNDFHVKN